MESSQFGLSFNTINRQVVITPKQLEATELTSSLKPIKNNLILFNKL
jgi:hypothetical protein